MLRAVGNSFGNWLPSRRFSSPRSSGKIRRVSTSANETESEDSSMFRRGPYDRGRAARSAGASSTQSQDNLSQLAKIEWKRESESFIDELVTELAGRKEENGQAMAELKECRQQIQDLTQKLAAREQDVVAQKEIVQNQKKRLKNLHSEAEKEINQRAQSIAALTRTTRHLTSEKTSLEKQNKQQALDIAQLQEAAETQKSHITELTGAILHSSTIATPSRDDDYFAGEFARLTGTIRHWILRYFEPQSAPTLSYGDLSETLTRFLAKTVLTYTGTITPETKVKIGRKEIEAGIARMLTERIFDSSFIFMVSDWPPISPVEFPKASDQETQKWRSQTASMLAQHSGFEIRFSNAVTSVTVDLQNCFTDHVKAGVEASRVKALRTIIEQAARLEIEISRELSRFQMPNICPGSRYHTENLDDRSGVVDASEDDSDPGDGEEQEEKRDEEKKPEEKKVRRRKQFIVETVLFPPVVRSEFDDEGKFTKTPIIIRKGVVMAIRS